MRSDREETREINRAEINWDTDGWADEFLKKVFMAAGA